jgi:tol-pal system protein YbgF
MKFQRLLFPALLLFWLSACTTVNELPTLGSDVAQLRSDVSSLKQDVSRVEETNKPLRKELANLNLRMDETNTHLQEMRGQADELQFVLKRKLKEMEERLALLEQGNPAITNAGDGNTAPGPSTLPPDISTILDPEEPYAAAYNIYKENRYEASRDAFKKFLQQFPQTEYSDNAQFWIGESYYKEENYEEAILAYEEAIKKYPQGNKVPDALLKQALCFRALGDKTSSKIIFQKVIEQYPESPQAEIARNEVKKSP